MRDNIGAMLLILAVALGIGGAVWVAIDGLAGDAAGMSRGIGMLFAALVLAKAGEWIARERKAG